MSSFGRPDSARDENHIVGISLANKIARKFSRLRIDVLEGLA